MVQRLAEFAVVSLAVCLLHIIGNAAIVHGEDGEQQPADFTFGDVKYHHRFTEGDQREYTPHEQGDLKTWTDMVTLHLYPAVKDGNGLAKTANTVLTNYKASRGRVIRTASVPRTEEKAAEHLIVVVFGRPDFIEVAFARFRMFDGTGSAIIFSHRVYGNEVGQEMSAWLKANGPQPEKTLMKWDEMPKPAN